MDGVAIIDILQESLFTIVVFGVFFGYALLRGRQALITLIFGLYLASLLALHFPYYEALLGEVSTETEVLLKIGVLLIFTFLCTLVLGRFMYTDGERGFKNLHRTLAIALAASVLTLAYSFHMLPITELVNPGPVQNVFTFENSFFVWLLAPLAIVFFFE